MLNIAGLFTARLVASTPVRSTDRRCPRWRASGVARALRLLRWWGWTLLWVGLGVGCASSEPELVPDRVEAGAVGATEFRLRGVPRSELLRARGPTLETRDELRVWVGGQPADVLGTDARGIRIRVAELPAGTYGLRVVGSVERVRDDALAVVAASEDAAGRDGGMGPDGSRPGVGMDAAMEGGVRDASADAGEESLYVPSGTCSGGSVGDVCECAAGDTCTIACRGECHVVCRPRSRCSVTAQDRSSLRCRPGAHCKFSGNDVNRVTCDASTMCQSEFRNEGTVVCAPGLPPASCCIVSCGRGCSGAPDC